MARIDGEGLIERKSEWRRQGEEAKIQASRYDRNALDVFWTCVVYKQSVEKILLKRLGWRMSFRSKDEKLEAMVDS